MIEKATKIEISRPDVLKVHGHTKIILTDAKTGAKKTIEHENTFQSSVLASFMRSLGAANNNPFANTTWKAQDIARNLVGGIFLFKDAINSAVEYMPAGNVMVANGAFGVSNNATPQELGSYNSIESNLGSNSISLVYDWGTSQGNGTIGCVCLTSETGGYIGYGNADGNEATPRALATNQTTQAIEDAQWFYNGYKYKFSAFDSSTNTVTITKQMAGLEKISLFYGRDATTKDYAVTGSPFYYGNTKLYAKQLNATKVILIPASNATRTLASGSSADFMIYDCSTDTISLQTINNTSGQALPVITGGNTSQGSVAALGIDASGNVYFSGDNSNNAKKFNTIGSYVGEITDSRGRNPGGGTQIAPGLLLQKADIGNLLMIDTVNGTAKKTNGIYYDGSGYIYTFNMYPDIDAWSLNQTDADGTARLYKNPFYLATINNLAEPITKDSTQTMKIIYTLTEANA